MFVELDRHDAQHVYPCRLVLENLMQLCFGCFAGQEEVERLVRDVRACKGVTWITGIFPPCGSARWLSQF